MRSKNNRRIYRIHLTSDFHHILLRFHFQNSLQRSHHRAFHLRVAVVSPGVGLTQEVNQMTLNQTQKDLFPPGDVPEEQIKNHHLHQNYAHPILMDTKLFAITQTGHNIDQRRGNFYQKIQIHSCVLMLSLHLDGLR